MTRRRWIADEVSGNRAAIIGEHARHLAQVLRAQIGQQYEISAEGRVHEAAISSIRPDRVEFELGKPVLVASPLPISVVISIFKFDRMEWAIEKCTELGVAAIVPLIAARTETHLASAAGKRVERWRRLAHAASEQSRRILPPEISVPMKLDQVLALQGDARLVLSEIEEQQALKDVLPARDGSAVLAFGPEGGWKQEELDAFSKAGWTSASLGPRILRTETAVIAAVALCLSSLAEVHSASHLNTKPATDH